MTLTRPERSAGRWWRDTREAALVQLNATSPPDEFPPALLRHIRHLCSGHNYRSISFDYAEVYVRSPRIGVCYCGVIKPVPDELLGVFPHEDCAGGALVPAGRFAFLYHEGRCSRCEFTARSISGRVVDGYERKPVSRKVVQG